MKKKRQKCEKERKGGENDNLGKEGKEGRTGWGRIGGMKQPDGGKRRGEEVVGRGRGKEELGEEEDEEKRGEGKEEGKEEEEE